MATQSRNPKNALVAGGTSGLNLEIAKRLAADGAQVTVLGRNPDRLNAAVRLLGGAADGFAADVRDADAVKNVFTEIGSKRGPIDIVVSGAAGNFPAPAAQLSPNGFRAVVDIDLIGTFNVLRAAYDHLAKPGACIVNITAMQSWVPTPLQAHVCAAKAGVDQLTRTLAMEWGPEGIRVNSVAPGPVEGTEGMRRLAPSADTADAISRSVPLRRWGRGEDIANAVAWLCSDQASYVTGVVLPVDGGVNLGGSSGFSALLGR